MFDVKDAIRIYKTGNMSGIEYFKYMRDNGFSMAQADELTDCVRNEDVFSCCAKKEYTPKTIKKLITLMKYRVMPEAEREQEVALAILEN